MMSISAKRFDIYVLDRNQTEHLLIKKCNYFRVKDLKRSYAVYARSLGPPERHTGDHELNIYIYLSYITIPHW